MVILSDSQQPTSLCPRLLINHHDCCETIKKFMMLIKRGYTDDRIPLKPEKNIEILCRKKSEAEKEYEVRRENLRYRVIYRNLPEAVAVNGQIKYLLTDHLGSVLRVFKEDGTQESIYSFDEFGCSMGDIPVYAGYAGYIPASEEVYATESRYYASSVRRFLTRDRWMGNMGNPQTLYGMLSIPESLWTVGESVSENGLLNTVKAMGSGIIDGITTTVRDDLVNGTAKSRGEIVGDCATFILEFVIGSKLLKDVTTKNAVPDADDVSDALKGVADKAEDVLKGTENALKDNADDILQKTDDVLEHMDDVPEVKGKGMEDAAENLSGAVDDVVEGGTGSKFQEVFDLADNYKLSDDTFNNHILDRHGPNSTYGNKSHFNAGFDIKEGIDSTLKGNNFVVGPNTAGREGYIFEQTFTNPIGTSSNGKPLYTLKVVIDEAGNVITAFPKK